MKLFLTIISIAVSLDAFAAGGGAHGHISDLLFPAINFFVLFGFIGWKLATPMRNMFNTKADDISKLYNFAEEKSREAEAKLSELQNKMATLDTEKKKIIEQSEREFAEFKVTNDRETTSQLEKMKSDNDLKLENEKAQLSRDLSATLIGEVIAQAKSSIKADSQSRVKVTSSLISKI